MQQNLGGQAQSGTHSERERPVDGGQRWKEPRLPGIDSNTSGIIRIGQVLASWARELALRT